MYYDITLAYTAATEELTAERYAADETYFIEPFEIHEEGAKPGAVSTLYFLDAKCTSPITYNEEGVYVVSSATTLYTPMKA